MTIEREMGLVLNGGLVTGLPPHVLGRQESPNCQNIDPSDPLGATTRKGSSQYGSSFTTGSGFRGAGIFPWTRNGGTTYIFAGVATTIYSIDSTGSWFSIKTGMASDGIMQGAALNNVAVVVASGIAPQVSSAGSTLANLGGTPPSLAKYVTVFAAKVWLAGDTGDPSKVNFSTSNNPEDWTTANNAGSITVEKDDGDTIQGLSGTKQILYIFKRKNTYAVSGDSPFNFRVDKLCAWGLVGEYAHATDGQGTFFASDDGIYYSAGMNVARISDPVRDTYENISDKSKITMEVRGEKLFVFYGTSGGENNQALVLAYKRIMSDGSVRGVWGLYSSQPFHAVKTGRDSSLYALTNASTMQIWKLDTGSSGAITAFWETPDMDFDDPSALKRLMRFFVHMKPPTATTTLTVRHYVDGASTGSDYSIEFGTTGSHIIEQRALQSRSQAQGVYHRIRISWEGQRTIYGFRVYADVRTDEVPRR